MPLSLLLSCDSLVLSLPAAAGSWAWRYTAWPIAPAIHSPHTNSGRATTSIFMARGGYSETVYPCSVRVLSCECAQHHAGLYVMLVHEAVVNLPANQLPSDRKWPKQILSDHFALLMNMPRAFFCIRRTGASWRQRTPDGYTSRVRNTGERRIRIEILYSEIQSPCGVSHL